MITACHRPVTEQINYLSARAGVFLFYFSCNRKMEPRSHIGLFAIVSTRHNRQLFVTSQELISIQDYCACASVFKGAPQQPVRRRLIELEHLKGEERRQVPRILSRPICLLTCSYSLPSLWARGFWEGGGGIWTSKPLRSSSETETISWGFGERRKLEF